MSEEARIIAEFVGGIFLVYITHYLTKSHYEKKRQDELADREANRLLDKKDKRREKRIAEAQECLNAFTAAATLISNVETMALVTKDASRVKADAIKILPLLNPPPNILMSMQFLDSPELATVGNEFRILLYDEHQRLFEMLMALHNDKAIDEEGITSSIKEFSSKAGRYSGKLQVILDKLASDLK